MNKRIKKLRNHYDLLQKDFGEKLGVSKQAVSNWETGAQKIPESQILAISRFFGVSADWLRNGSGEMFPSSTTSQRPEQSRDKIFVELIEIICKLDEKSLSTLKALAEQFEKECLADQSSSNHNS